MSPKKTVKVKFRPAGPELGRGTFLITRKYPNGTTATAGYAWRPPDIMASLRQEYWILTNDWPNFPLAAPLDIEINELPDPNHPGNPYDHGDFTGFLTWVQGLVNPQNVKERLIHTIVVV